MEYKIPENITVRLQKIADKRSILDIETLINEYIEAGLNRSEGLNLSDGERLILSILPGIAVAVESNTAKDATKLNNALCDGHNWAVKREFSNVIHDHTDSEEDYELVSKILEMFRGLKTSADNLSKNDRDLLDNFDSHWEENIKFSGFDGNYEGSYYSIAQHMMEEMGLYRELKLNDYNSGFPKMHRYKAMYLKYIVHKSGAGTNPISASSITDVLVAGSAAKL